jgi:HD-GYP domain-containing protein (c-di-GMP phosphodiesterase class II)
MSERQVVLLPPQLLAEGRLLVLQLNANLRTLFVHGPNNAAFLSALDKLIETINGLLPHVGGRLELRVYDDIVMLNGGVLRANAQTAAVFSALGRQLALRGVGGLTFTRSMDQELLRHWFLRFGQPADTADQRALIHRSLGELTGHGIETHPLLALTRQDLEVVRLNSLSFALQAYGRAVLGFRAFVLALEGGRDPFRGKLNLVRVVQDLVDIAVTSPGLLRRVLAMRDEHREAFVTAAGDYAARHAASTCLWSLLVGATLELGRFELLDLGTSALLAKVGFALLPEDMTEKPGELSAEERRQVRLATVRAVQALIAKSRLSDIMMRRVVVAYEHQRPYAHPTGEPTNTHVYSRIVAVTDAFDAMLTPRPWRGALPAEVAVQNLRAQAGQRFDPVLVGLLAEVSRAAG